MTLTAFCDDRVRHVKLLSPVEEASDYEWRPVKLTEAESKLLKQRSSPPRSALDFYLLLSRSYFENVDDSLERRIAFIDRETLTPTYLHAEFTIPVVDAGAFSISIRIFEKGEEPLIAICHRSGRESLYEIENERKAKPGELIRITVGRPEFWRYRKEKWIPEKATILPSITKEFVLDRYRKKYKGHLNYPTQKKYIWLNYDLPPSGELIQVTGKENFMSPDKKYVWAEFTFDGDRFAPTPNSEESAGKPAPAVDSKSE